MTVFATLAALLTAATISILGFSLARRPRSARANADDLNAAVYRDQLAELDAQLADGALGREHHARAREAIRERLARELQTIDARVGVAGQKGMAIAVAFLVTAGAAVLYATLGTPAALAPKPAAARDAAAHGLQSEQIAAMVDRLAVRLKENPKDLNGWVMLARSYSALGRFPEAAAAYRDAASLAPGDAALLADYADVLAMAQGRSFAGEPDRIVARALEADPRHIKTLALAGSSAFARRDYQAAIGYWKRVQEQVPPESQIGASIEASLAQARQLAGEKAAVAAAVPAAKADAAASPASVTGTVQLDPKLASRVAPGDTLFIYARASSGSRMPLAIVRQGVGAWPVAFRLDDSHAMSPQARISTQREVALEARISKTGGAAAAAGDLRGIVDTVKTGASGVTIVIGSVVE